MLGLGNNFSRGGVLTGFPNTYSLDFDAVDDYVDCGSGSTIDDVFAGGGTVSAWIKPDSAGEGDNYGRIASKALNNGWEVYTQGTVDGLCKISFYVDFDGAQDGRWDTDNTVITLGAWNHVAVTYDNGNVANNALIYINGVSVAVTEGKTPSAGSTRVDDSGQDLWIGNRTDLTKTFDGKIDEVSIWDVALDADAVSAIYNSGTPIALDADLGNYDNSGDLQGWWRMGDGTEGASGTTIYDMSTNSNNGTMTNMDAATDYVTDVPE